MKIATYKIELWPTPNSDGSHTVKLRITHSRKSKYYSLRMQCSKEQWDSSAQRFRKNYPDFRRGNDLLMVYEKRISDKLFLLERELLPFEWSDVEEAVFGSGSEEKQQSAISFIQDYAKELREDSRIGNARYYEDLIRSLQKFDSKVLLSDIDSAWLTKWERWMKQTRKMKGTGIYAYHRALRAICNRAIKTKVMPREWYPYEDYGLGHLDKTTRKKAIPEREIKQFEAVAVPDKLKLYQDLFMFSYYTGGINIADIASLTPENLKNGRIEYYRKKTGKFYSMAITPRNSAILDRYKGEKYCFPILSEIHTSAQSQYNRIKKVSKQINDGVREVATLAGLDSEDITFYTARHTVATVLKLKGTSVEVIKEYFGHSDIKTTDTYLKSFDWSVLDEAGELL